MWPMAQPKERRGAWYRRVVEQGYADRIDNGDMSQHEVARRLGTTQATVSRIMKAYRMDEAYRKDLEKWSPPDDVAKTLDDFMAFRAKYFRTERGEPYETAPFHRKWIEAILATISDGEQQMILSPPRHGKTDLLTHFCVWVIVRNPNIRIMWVGGNEDIAKNAVGSVADHLENNHRLITDFTPPGGAFRPTKRSGKTWSQSQITVDTRTVAGIKSPTLVAVGKGGKILSRDTDLIVCDDIEDHATTIQPQNRENTRNWMTTTLGSRKEEHTAIIVIGSRQHPDDLYHHLLENTGWRVIVEEAHSTDCELDLDNIDVHVECMLWPHKRTFKWLEGRRIAAETTGGRAVFEMVYLNRPIAEGLEIFPREAIDESRNAKRGVGLDGVPTTTRLIAGLDPAAVGYQASFLWAVDLATGNRWMVDLENDEGGGLVGFRRIVANWYEKYQVRHWVVEENNFQRVYIMDDTIRDYTASNGIYVEGHETYANKWDPVMGVTSMASLFTDGKIDLPYADAEAIRKTNLYRRQLIHFGTAAGLPVKRNRARSDLVMASWFPHKAIRRLQKETKAHMAVNYEPSYGWYQPMTNQQVPWRARG